MKKRIIIFLIAVLFTTGCTCEYNLKITNGEYQEEIKLTGTNSDEIDRLNTNFNIPVNEEEYNHPGDSSTTEQTDTEVYNYTFNNNTATFTYTFGMDDYQNSSAVSNCYNTLTVDDYNDSTIISTSQQVNCFNKYPTLSSIKVNVTIDGVVTSHNADSVNGNVYTWNLTRNNASKKGINIIFKEKDDTGTEVNNIPTKKKRDYSMIILSGILLLVFLIGYAIFNKIKNNGDRMDD